MSMSLADSAPESAFPARPVAPRVFVEDVIPALFVDLDLTDAERAVELQVGVVLAGEGGGAWTLHFVEGELGILESRRADCDFTIAQTVEDWRAALWEGRPAFVADALRVLLRPESIPSDSPLAARVAAARRPDPRALAELRKLRGLVEIRVAGDASDWRLGIRFGPGPMPPRPDASIELAAEQAEAIRRGELHPLEALMTGELRLEGDLGLVLELQAIALMATWTG